MLSLKATAPTTTYKLKHSIHSKLAPPLPSNDNLFLHKTQSMNLDCCTYLATAAQ